MSLIDSIGIVLTILVYHEAAHAIAADRYGALVAINLIAPKRLLGKLLCGAAVQVDDDELTKRQLLVTLLAPLAYLPLAGGAYGMYVHTGSEVWSTGALVLGGAALAVFISDVPMYLFDGLDEDNYHMYTLYRFAESDPS